MIDIPIYTLGISNDFMLAKFIGFSTSCVFDDNICGIHIKSVNVKDLYHICYLDVCQPHNAMVYNNLMRSVSTHRDHVPQECVANLTAEESLIYCHN